MISLNNQCKLIRLYEIVMICYVYINLIWLNERLWILFKHFYKNVGLLKVLGIHFNLNRFSVPKNILILGGRDILLESTLVVIRYDIAQVFEFLVGFSIEWSICVDLIYILVLFYICIIPLLVLKFTKRHELSIHF